MGMEINGTQGTQQRASQYTPVKIKEKETGKSFVINFLDAEITGNKNKWKIKDGKVYNADGKEIKNKELKLTKYQAALLKAAARGDGNGAYLDEKDLIGSGYGQLAAEELKRANSKFRLAKDTTNNPPLPFGDADAMEHGMIYANVENNKGEKGHLEIKLLDHYVTKEVYDIFKDLF